MFTAAEWTAIALSIKVASVAVLASLPFGIAMAYVLARKKFRGRSLLDGLVHLPLVLPPVVTGYLLLLTFGRRGFAGAFLENCCGLTFSFRWTGAALAAGLMGFPLMVRAIRLSIEAADQRLEAAAATLGASPFWVFWTIILPQATPGIIAGLVIAFAKALGEFGATITFVSAIPGETQTIPAAIYAYTQTPGGEQAALRMCLAATVLAFAALLASEFFNRRQTSPENSE